MVATPLPPSGGQIDLSHGDQRVVVVEVGGGLRSYSAGGRDVLDGYGPGEMCRSGRGQVLSPWPNRLQDGSYEFGGRRHQLPLTEPEHRNAIHGLVRWEAWAVTERDPHRVVLRHVVHPRPGYPFSLVLQMDYQLSDAGLLVRSTATNAGAEPCPYGSGAHPYLTLGTATVDPVVLRVPARTVLHTDDRGIPVGAEPVDGGVRIRGLTAGWERPAFRNLRLDIPAGGATVVLGPSGSGKSTLAAVLAGFLDPAAGSVTIGGAALGALGEDVLRRAVVLVGDETEHVFASTVRENLRLARPRATDAELERVLQRVGLDGWGKTLDTPLGSGGSTLSGGQRKRLATARALLADPLLLILDEPTEGLDSDGAEALMTDLLTAADDRAVLVLTHRTDGLQRVPRGRVHVIGDLVVPVPDGQRPGRLEHQDRGAGVGDRLVLGAARDHEDAALRQGDAAVPQLDGQGAVQDQEELVGVVVGVPDVLAVHLGDADVVVVDAGDDARAPQLVERGQRVGE